MQGIDRDGGANSFRELFYCFGYKGRSSPRSCDVSCIQNLFSEADDTHRKPEKP